MYDHSKRKFEDISDFDRFNRASFEHSGTYGRSTIHLSFTVILGSTIRVIVTVPTVIVLIMVSVVVLVAIIVVLLIALTIRMVVAKIVAFMVILRVIIAMAGLTVVPMG